MDAHKYICIWTHIHKQENHICLCNSLTCGLFWTYSTDLWEIHAHAHYYHECRARFRRWGLHITLTHMTSRHPPPLPHTFLQKVIHTYQIDANTQTHTHMYTYAYSTDARHAHGEGQRKSKIDGASVVFIVICPGRPRSKWAGRDSCRPRAVQWRQIALVQARLYVCVSVSVCVPAKLIHVHAL